MSSHQPHANVGLGDGAASARVTVKTVADPISSPLKSGEICVMEGLDAIGGEARQERVGSAGAVIKIIKGEELIDLELFNYEACVRTNVIDALEALLICSTHDHRSLALRLNAWVARMQLLIVSLDEVLPLRCLEDGLGNF